MAPARPRLTRHQRETLASIAGLGARRPDGWVPSGYIGSRQACRHLEEKGYILVEDVIGPRGGIAGYRYRVITAEERAA